MGIIFFLKKRHLLVDPDVRTGLHGYLLVCTKMQENAQSRTILFKWVHLLSYQTNVVHKNSGYYLEFHHRVPAHLVSWGVWYRIHSDQLGFITNASAVKTGDDVTDCLRSSWETPWEETKGLCESEELWIHVYLCYFSLNYTFSYQRLCVFEFHDVSVCASLDKLLYLAWNCDCMSLCKEVKIHTI